MHLNIFIYILYIYIYVYLCVRVDVIIIELDDVFFFKTGTPLYLMVKLVKTHGFPLKIFP